jgi:hypothetical protein
MLAITTAGAGILGGAIGFIVGAFTPKVGREIKAEEVKVAKGIVAKAEGTVTAVAKKL